MQKSMTRRTIVAGVLVVLAAIVVAAVLLSDDSSDRPYVDPQIAEHQNYQQKQYAVGVVNSWPRDPSDRRVGGYLESSWHYPRSAASTFTVYSRAADETGSPAAVADLARVQTLKLPGYDERGLREEGLRGNQAVRWIFDLADTVYVEYFFEECGISFVTRGSAPSGIWHELSGFFREMTALTTANCDE
jgi:hypothetical protein